jgi:hypothetical protein
MQVRFSPQKVPRLLGSHRVRITVRATTRLDVLVPYRRDCIVDTIVRVWDLERYAPAQTGAELPRILREIRFVIGDPGERIVVSRVSLGDRYKITITRVLCCIV